MSRLIRCVEGHIFEADKGATCPVCGSATASGQASATAAVTATPVAAEIPAAARGTRKIAAAGAILATLVVAPVVYLQWPDPRTPSGASKDVQSADAVKPKNRRLPDSDLNVAMGDTLDAIRTAYQIRDEPSHNVTPGSGATMDLWLAKPEAGLKFVLAAIDRLVTEIEITPPFAGRVLGLGLGDTRASVKSALGAPGQTIMQGTREAALEYTRSDCDCVVKLSFDPNDRLSRLQLFRGETFAATPAPGAASIGIAGLGESGLPDTDIAVRIGQTAASVFAAYNLHQMTSAPANDSKRPPRGATFSFKAGRVASITLKPPFAEQVLGHRPGDDIGKVTAALGTPARTFKLGSTTEYFYHRPGWSGTVRFDVGSDGKIGAISIF